MPRQASHHAGLTGSASLTFFPPLEKLPTPEPPDPNLSITPTPPLANAIDAATPGLKKAPEAEVADILAEMLGKNRWPCPSPPTLARVEPTHCHDTVYGSAGHIRRGDWAKYAKMCDPEMTCIEPESQNMRVSGLPFHQVSIFCPPASAQAYAVPSQQWTEEQPTQASFD